LGLWIFIIIALYLSQRTLLGSGESVINRKIGAQSDDAELFFRFRSASAILNSAYTCSYSPGTLHTSPGTFLDSPSVPMVSIGRHPNWGTQPPLSQTGPSIVPENWYVGGTLAGIQLQRESIPDGHVGGEQTHIPPGPCGPALRNG